MIVQLNKCQCEYAFNSKFVPVIDTFLTLRSIKTSRLELERTEP